MSLPMAEGLDLIFKGPFQLKALIRKEIPTITDFAVKLSNYGHFRDHLYNF